ncbi:MAG TPA: cyclic nucleotide-binding domain-containing protein [Steroidobacteraceae bacterium]|nr:cyclic nucleotide-binding domain-containing protein [Steroidobacteraceae bacterium]
MTQGRPVDVPMLRQFTPLNGMKKENQAALARKVFVREMDPGRLLFKQGDTEKRTIWVVTGTVELREDERTVGVIKGGTPEARNPLPAKLPREFSARAMDNVEYLSIDSELLDVMITWDQTGTYEVAELQSQFQNSEGDDWMTTLLQSRAMQRIPPANIQAIFLRMQRMPYRAGDVVIRQGAEGDFFYAVVSGKCVVTRETPLNKEGIKLAELGVGDTFGEEALISEAKRNATVTMQTEGVLMRLKKEDFRELMNEPLLQWVTAEQAEQLVEKKGGVWLDVRLPSEFQNLAVEGAMNVPLYFIRLKLSGMDKGKPYIVYCDTGRRSSAAAFIMVEKGFDAYVLKGGLSTMDRGLRRAATV